MIERKRIVSHPGIYIKDAIDELGLNQSEFALRTGLSIKNVSTLISGDSNITFEVALKLAAFFGNSVEGWTNLQTKYDLYMSTNQLHAEYEQDWNIAKTFDKDFVKNYLRIDVNSKRKEESVNKLREAFAVGTLQSLKHPDLYAFCKTSVSKDVSEEMIIMRNAWISIAERKARNLSCAVFNKEQVISQVGYLKSLSKEKPNIFVPKLQECLSNCGVKLVILPYLPKSNISGVTKWIATENCVLVAINDCGKDADRFWFSLFHELGHAIKNHKRHLTISYEKGKINDDEENEANEFAKNSLINPKAYSSFVNKKQFDLKSIQSFALQQNVADFIVIGRLQKDRYLSWDKYQNRKIKYNVMY